MKPSTMRLITAACIVFALGVAAFGARAEDPKPATEGLTVSQALEVVSGLRQLVGQDTVDKDGKPSKVFYKFAADTRILIAVNIDVGRAIETRVNTVQNELVMAISNGSGSVPEEKRGLFNVELSKLMLAQSRAGYTKIKMVDLKLDDNQIPAPILALIIPILDR